MRLQSVVGLVLLGGCALDELSDVIVHGPLILLRCIVMTCAASAGSSWHSLSRCNVVDEGPCPESRQPSEAKVSVLVGCDANGSTARPVAK